MSTLTLPVTDLTALDPAAVQNELAVLAEMVQEANPTIDAKRGVLHDVLFYNEAILATATQTNISLYVAARSILEISNNPALADPEITDSVLSFYRITRLPGAAATGMVTMVVSSQLPFTIPFGATFTANGQTFATNTVYSTQDNPALVITPTDVYMAPRGDGNFTFQIAVTATTTAAAGNLSQNTVLSPDTTYGTFVTAYASSDFLGGADSETNAQLLDRLLSGTAAQCLSNRMTMTALLGNQSQFTGIIADSIVGMGDAEMRRDQHSLWPSGGGGRLDWYIRTQGPVQYLQLPITATLVSVSGPTTSVWQFGISRNLAPGFYDISQILLATASNTLGGYAILSDTRSYDLTNVVPPPDIVSPVEAAYSRYQTSVVQFTDTDTPTTGLTPSTSQQAYNVTVRMLPSIDTIQDYVSSRQVRAAAADTLVKAPIPCFLNLSLTIYCRVTDTSPNVANIATSLAKVVNTGGFTGRLPASILSETVQAQLTGFSSCSSIDMFGLLRRPDGVQIPLRSSETLLVPSLPDVMTTSRTVNFFLNPADVAIAVTVVDMPEV